MSSKDHFPTIFDFTFLFFKVLSQDGEITNLYNIESSLLHIFYNIQKYTFIPIFTRRFEIIVAATLGKNLVPPMPKRCNESCLQENQEL